MDKVSRMKFALLLSLVLLSVAPIVKADKVTDWNAVGAQALLTAGKRTQREV